MLEPSGLDAVVLDEEVMRMNVKQVYIQILCTTDNDTTATDHGITATDHGITTTDHGITATGHSMTTTDHGMTAIGHGTTPRDQSVA